VLDKEVELCKLKALSGDELEGLAGHVAALRWQKESFAAAQPRVDAILNDNDPAIAELHQHYVGLFPHQPSTWTEEHWPQLESIWFDALERLPENSPARGAFITWLEPLPDSIRLGSMLTDSRGEQVKVSLMFERAILSIQSDSASKWREASFIKALRDRVRKFPDDANDAVNLAGVLMDYYKLQGGFDYWLAHELGELLRDSWLLESLQDASKTKILDMVAYLIEKGINIVLEGGRTSA
jgi:hypothetical protein